MKRLYEAAPTATTTRRLTWAIENTLVPNSDLLNLQSKAINGASGIVFQPSFSCPPPATRCSFDDVDTLALCSSYEDLTPTMKTNCSGDTYVQLNCTHDYKDRPDDLSPVTMQYNQQGTTNAPATYLWNSLVDVVAGPDTQTTSAVMTAVRVVNNTMDASGKEPPPTRMFQARWFWCAQTTRNVSIVNGAVVAPRNQTTSEPLSFRALRSGLTEATSTSPMGTPYYVLVANSTGKVYNISRTGEENFHTYLASLLARKVTFSPLPRSFDPDNDLDMGYFLYTTDLENMTSNMASAVTGQMRSQDPGDNFNATSRAGTATFSETYIHVRWGWLVLPMAEAVLAAVLMSMAIVATMSQPQLKESVMPYFVYGLDPNVREGIVRREPWGADDMEAAAKEYLVGLREGKDGRLRLE